ncbi:MAG: hypothetical protein MUE83_09455 [Tabrizicola sp.]|jgi:hypothetical protein|nr:hypothetical protein [Tabrizicola sp.]
MRELFQILQRLILLTVVAGALSATGFAHHVPSKNESALQAYVLAGGDLGDLCADEDGDGLPDHADCPACHIVASLDLPAADLTLRDADLAFVVKVVAPRESRAVRGVLDPARGMRAPPLA